jgi:hypothetical protein
MKKIYYGNEPVLAPRKRRLKTCIACVLAELKRAKKVRTSTENGDKYSDDMSGLRSVQVIIRRENLQF